MEDEKMKSLHEEAMRLMNETNDLTKLPKINKRVLLAKLKSDILIERQDDIKAGDLVELADSLLSGKSIEESEDLLKESLKRSKIEESEYSVQDVIKSISEDVSIKYMIEELNRKDERTAEIYASRHEETMQKLNSAQNFDELPEKRSEGVLSNYLASNSGIYVEDVKFTVRDFKPLTSMLLSGTSIEDEAVANNINEMVREKYPEDSERIGRLLVQKIRSLPNTAYLAEEIKKKNEKEAEFFEQGLRDVNLYVLPKTDSRFPRDGGKAYACYINTGKALSMDLLTSISEGMDLRDSQLIAEYIRENYDPTFKVSGANLLEKGTRIKSVYIAGETKPESEVEIETEPEPEIEEIDEGSGVVTLSVERYNELLEAEEKAKKYSGLGQKIKKLKDALDEIQNDLDIDGEEVVDAFADIDFEETKNTEEVKSKEEI